jgi:hypothetical protein
MAKNLKINGSSKSGKVEMIKSVSGNHETSVAEALGTAAGTASAADTGIIVRDAKTGRFLTVKGAGALKDSSFAIKKGIDLTKPIAKQALRGSSKLAG